MPNKIETERQWLHIICPQQHDLEWKPCITASYQPKHTPLSALLPRYTVGLPDAFDILVVTGAPLGQKPFQEIVYWQELQRIFKHCEDRAIPIFASCWAAHALLLARYQLPVQVRSEKLFGVFSHTQTMQHAITQKLPKELYLPHSRYAFIAAEVLRNKSQLTPLLESEAAGPSLILTQDHNLLLLGHPEYAQDTLLFEYQRDKRRGLSTALPEGLDATHANADNLPVWQNYGQVIFAEWLAFLRSN